MSHRITSIVVMTSWSSRQQISCRSCGLKSQAFSGVYCLFLGWWGIPWGILGTPIQILRNIGEMVKPPDPATPSPELQRVVRSVLAQQIAAQNPGAPAPPISDIPQGMATTTAAQNSAPPIPAPGKATSAPSPFSDIGKPMK